MESAVGRLADIALKSWGVEDAHLRRKSAVKLNLSLKGGGLSMKELLAQRGKYYNLAKVEKNITTMCSAVMYLYLNTRCCLLVVFFMRLYYISTLYYRVACTCNKL